jgi:threonylcarbamoyladenosine tRNA methylthiotransferase MtaB
MKIFLDTVGCRLNQSEIERMARDFRSAGHTIVGSMTEAEMVVVNTCAVTSQASSDSRQKLRQAARLSPEMRIVGTGCWATLDPEAVLDISQNTTVVINRDKDSLPSDVLGIDITAMDLSPLERESLPGSRHRIRAFIKVQDGCDAHCTFCVTRIARGTSRGEPVERILADIRSALDGGAQEIVLTGVQLGSWGRHFSKPGTLTEMVKTILGETDIPRLRFSSIEPWDIDRDFFDLFVDPRICRHLHVALQSGSAATLKRMGRQLTPAEFLEKLELARQLDADFAITTDIITGFPGETLEELHESMDFIRLAAFSGGHVFPYSARQGTPAENLPGQIQSKIRKIRAAEVRVILAECAAVYKQRLVGKTGRVLWEMARPEANGYILEGLNEEYIRVTAHADKKLINVICPVRFQMVTESGMTGEILLSA